MARKRMIDPKFWSDDKMMALTPRHRLLFIGIWNFSDDGGIHKNSNTMLKAEVFPCDDIVVDQVGKLKDELIELITSFQYTYESKQIEYNTYRGSRNLKDRNKKVYEYLWIIQK